MSFQERSDSLRSRLKMGEANRPFAIGICVLMAVIAICILAYSTSLAAGSQAGSDEGITVERASETEEEAAAICVYVSGSVASPGVCYLPPGSRVADAVSAAGGMLPDAARSALNLARTLEDGEHIVVLSQEEAERAVAPEGQSSRIESGGTDAAVASSSSVTGSAGGSKVNINTSSASELQTLKGIGKAKAERIIEYREANGGFKSIDELTKVNGIGSKTLEAIRDGICV